MLIGSNVSPRSEAVKNFKTMKTIATGMIQRFDIGEEKTRVGFGAQKAESLLGRIDNNKLKETLINDLSGVDMLSYGDVKTALMFGLAALKEPSIQRKNPPSHFVKSIILFSDVALDNNVDDIIQVLGNRQIKVIIVRVGNYKNKFEDDRLTSFGATIIDGTLDTSTVVEIGIGGTTPGKYLKFFVKLDLPGLVLWSIGLCI